MMGVYYIEAEDEADREYEAWFKRRVIDKSGIGKVSDLSPKQGVSGSIPLPDAK